MGRAFLAVALLANLPSLLYSQEAGEAASLTPRQLVEADPNNTKAWDAYWGEQYRIIATLLNSDPKAAEQVLAEVEALVRDHRSTTEQAIKHVGLMKGTFASLRKSLAFNLIPLAELEKQLLENPDEPKALANYQRKLRMELAPLALSDAKQAAEQLAAVKAALQKVKDAAKQAASKDSIDQVVKSLASIDQDIIAGRKQSDLVGQQAAPLHIDAWVNGKPLTDDDLKGKVVILDFWAVWCGPCIATFPHLREWQEQYGDKGLVIVGVTKYYNFRWDDEAQRPARADEDVDPADEAAMLEKFAESHSLKHRFAIQESNELSEYYGVKGIPQIVVIDQQGKIQLIRVGSGEENANAVSELLKKLLTEQPAEKSADK